MTYGEVKNKLMAVAQELEGKTNFNFLGFRIEAREYKVGDIMEGTSRTNLGREDERDFPAYGTEEYEELEELDGLCAYDLGIDFRTIDSIEEQLNQMFRGLEDREYTDGHMYVIGTNDYSDDFAEDNYEIVMPNPTVLAVIA